MKATSDEKCESPQVPSQAEVRQAMVRILSSKHFANAPTKQRFLQIICEAYLNGREHELNEYMIGCEVFNRLKDYNPALDPIVRVGAHGLRKKLGAYYNDEGKNDEVILDIPVGSYSPIFRRRAQPQEASEPPKAPPSPSPSDSSNTIDKKWIALLILTIALLIITILTLAFSNKQLRMQSGPDAVSKTATGVFTPVWGSFMKDANPALLVLGNPPVYRFVNPADPLSSSRIRIDLAPEEAKAMADALGREKLVVNISPTPQLMLSYKEFTSVGEAIGLHRIALFFNKMGKDVTLVQSHRLNAEAMKNQNAILLGTDWVKEWVGNVPIRRCFTTGPGAIIINQNLIAGDKWEYSAKFDEETGKLIEDYAIITVKPGISERKTIMVLAGTHSEGTLAAAEYLTDESYLAELNRTLRQSDGSYPRYFQVLLKVSVDDGTPTNISVVKVRSLQPSR